MFAQSAWTGNRRPPRGQAPGNAIKDLAEGA